MKYLIIVLILFINNSFAQLKFAKLFELEGNFQYNFISTHNPWGNYARNYDYSHNIIIQPEIAYFISDNLELFSDIEYSFLFSKWNSFHIINSNNERPDAEQVNDMIEHTIGLYLGTGYNYPFTSNLIGFLGSRIGFTTSRWIYTQKGTVVVHGNRVRIEPVNERYDSKWGNREFCFPSFILSLKFLPSENWIIILKTQYTRRDRFENISGYSKDLLTFGFGLGTYIK